MRSMGAGTATLTTRSVLSERPARSEESGASPRSRSFRPAEPGTVSPRRSCRGTLRATLDARETREHRSTGHPTDRRSRPPTKPRSWRAGEPRRIDRPKPTPAQVAVWRCIRRPSRSRRPRYGKQKPDRPRRAPEAAHTRRADRPLRRAARPAVFRSRRGGPRDRPPSRAPS